MKVLFVWRGPSPYRVDFFNELGKHCELTVLFEMRPNDIKDKKLEWFNENYEYFHGIYLKHVNILGKVWFCYNIFKYLRQYKRYDVIVLGMYSTVTQMLAILYMKLFHIRYVISSDGGFVKKESFVSKSIKHFLISKASGYLSSSKGTSEYLKYYGANEPIYIYPFTSSKKSQILKKCNTNKSVIKKQLNIPEEKIVLYTGQFIHRKGIDILLKACVNLKKDCGVYIVGGEPIHEYIDIVQKYELRNIHFIGFKIPSDLKSYYEVADIYVLPTREDVWGLVINEAMAYGIPIITTNKCLAGMELIDDGQNGFIVPVDDVVALSNKINLLLDNRNMRDVMKENNIKKIQDYSIENMAKVHIDIFIDYIRRYE